MVQTSQIHLDPRRLRILSVPRAKAWIFAPAVLWLLHQEARHTAHSSGSDFEFDTDSDLESLDSQLGRFVGALSIDNSLKTPHESPEDPDSRHFFHVAYTPTEMTVICAGDLVSCFEQPLDLCRSLGYNDVLVLEEPYLNLQVDSDGDLNNSARILELTQPLSEHEISLFFISSHFSNIVLIPHRLREQVVGVLERKGVGSMYGSKNWEPVPLVGSDIKPQIDPARRLLLTGARLGEIKNAILKAAQCVALGHIPGYFALTRTSHNEVSLMLPGRERKRQAMGFGAHMLIGLALDLVVPVTVDLTTLPLDSVGIVAGLAGSIMHKAQRMGPFEMSYLLMARAGVLMIPEETVDQVRAVLNV